MSKQNIQIKNVIFSISVKTKSLTYIAITPPSQFGDYEVEPSVVNGQQITDNSLRVWGLLLKKLYSKFNSQKSYFTNFCNAHCCRDAYCHGNDALCHCFYPILLLN